MVKLGDLILMVAPLGLAVVYITFNQLRRAKRKEKDVYGFSLPGWVVITDDLKLFEIEKLFTEGFIAKTIEKEQYSIRDWHSNIQKPGTEQISGFIQLELSTTVSTYNHDLSGNGGGGIGSGYAVLDRHSVRYYLSQLPKAFPEFMHVSSKELDRDKKETLKAILTEIQELEALMGFENWDLIIYEKQLVVLVPEIFERDQLMKFLALSERIASKLHD